jgi:probable rRNA maturation factor
VIGGLDEIGVVLVSDRRIAALHGEFMSDPTPTDVITFLHGEIVLSAETARREARRRGLPVPEEVARYAVHGLLHLAGWSDADAGSAAKMRAMQEKILRRALRVLC